MAGSGPPAGRTNVAFPTLGDDDLRRLQGYGTVQDVAAGQVLFAPGDRDYDLIVLLDATVSILQRDGDDEVVIATHGAGRFLGELNLLTGSQLMVTARVDEPGRIVRIPVGDVRRLLDREGDLARTIVDAFLARRAILQQGVGARSIQLLGSRFSPETLQLRQYLTRMRLPHTWEDLEERADVDTLLERAGVGPADTPVVVLPTGVLRSPTPADVAVALGLSFEPVPGEVVDLVVVGAGPAGLAAAVYAASEGLGTLVVEGTAPGGQAGTSSLIENYLGFPSGISGRELTDLAAAQAQRFGARLTLPCEVVTVTTDGGQHAVHLATGDVVASRAVLVATGARYRRLTLEGWDRLEGAGIYHAATELEARNHAGEPVAVIGGGNSAGQAALYLAEHASSVQLLTRRAELTETMSRYLIDRIDAHPRITLRAGSEVAAVHGADRLEAIAIMGPDGDDPRDEPCTGLFCFIGAAAATGWLPDEVSLDADGFVLTDRDLPEDDRRLREPLPLESSVPGLFAAGDVRHGSMKRVAAAVGEGAAAVSAVHRYLAGE